MAVPFPPRPFDDHPFDPPHIFPAERDFEFRDQDNEPTPGYLRRAGGAHDFVYTRFAGRILFNDGRRRIFEGCKYVRERDGRYRATNRVVIKKLKRRWIDNNPHNPENVRNEIIVAQQLGDDQHVVTMTEVLEDDRYRYIIMPLLGRDILNTVDALRDEGYTIRDMPRFTRPMVANLIFIKGHGIIHRDTSPENIIVKDQPQENGCPLIDFAMALRCYRIEGNDQLVTSQVRCGKLGYMSPEVHYSHPLGFGVDVWAVGCILFVLWTGVRLYEGPGDRCWDFFIENDNIRLAHEQNLDHYLTTPGFPPDYVHLAQMLLVVQSLSDVQRDLLSKMLTRDPSRRITAEAILEHPYYQQR